MTLPNKYARESVEFQPVTVTVNGAVVTAGVAFAVVDAQTRPTVFTAAVVLGAQIGVMVQGLRPGPWYVFARIDAIPEIPVVPCGFFVVT